MLLFYTPFANTYAQILIHYPFINLRQNVIVDRE